MNFWRRVDPISQCEVMRLSSALVTSYDSTPAENRLSPFDLGFLFAFRCVEMLCSVSTATSSGSSSCSLMRNTSPGRSASRALKAPSQLCLLTILDCFSRIEEVTRSGELGSVVRLKQFTQVRIRHQEVNQLKCSSVLTSYLDFCVLLLGCATEQTHKSTKGPAELRVLEDVMELEPNTD